MAETKRRRRLFRGYFMRNATGSEVQQWLDEHPEEVVVEVKEI